MITYRITPVRLALLCVAAMVGTQALSAGEVKSTEIVAGPNGGRIVTTTEPHFEFFVKEDGKITITFLSQDGEPVPFAGQSLTAVGGDRRNPTRISFAEKDGVLVSDQALPKGDMIPIVLRVKMTPEAKVINVKFTVNLSTCPECHYKEYACICGHEDDGEDELTKP